MYDKVLPSLIHIWAASWQNQQDDCTQRRQISLGVRPVWSESSLCTQWVAKDPSILHVDYEDSDQTGWMPRLICIFAGRTCHFVGFAMRRLISSSLHQKQIETRYQQMKSDITLWCTCISQDIILQILMASNQKSHYIQKCIRIFNWYILRSDFWIADHSIHCCKLRTLSQTSNIIQSYVCCVYNCIRIGG